MNVDGFDRHCVRLSTARSAVFHVTGLRVHLWSSWCEN
jgi:hypothetical protein